MNFSNQTVPITQKKLKVGIVDDSVLVRQLIKAVIESDPEMQVAFEAADPYEAREKIKMTLPDVITLDIEMPKMNGIAFLDKIMRLRPMPVIMVSTLTQKSAFVTLQALEMGAADYVAKPDVSIMRDDAVSIFQRELLPKLHSIRSMNMHASKDRALKIREDKSSHPFNMQAVAYDVIAVASSTGGIERLRYLVEQQRKNIPPILIVQHINKGFVPSMVERMQAIAPPHIAVKIAFDGAFLEQNTIYFADNRQHLSVVKKGKKLAVRLFNAPPLNGFIASADYLFGSLAAIKEKDMASLKVLAFILSGMGNDGAQKALSLRHAGADVYGEEADSCLVYGMPKAAKEMGAVAQEFSIEGVSKILNNDIKRGSKA